MANQIADQVQTETLVRRLVTWRGGAGLAALHDHAATIDDAVLRVSGHDDLLTGVAARRLAWPGCAVLACAPRKELRLVDGFVVGHAKL